MPLDCWYNRVPQLKLALIIHIGQVLTLRLHELLYDQALLIANKVMYHLLVAADVHGEVVRL